MSDDLDSLLSRCKVGDERAVSELVQRHRPWALKAASGIVHDAGLAEDVVQEAFVAALQRLDSLRSPQAFRSWFRRIVRTHATRMLRKRREASLDDDNAVPHDGPSPGQIVERAEAAERVTGALAALPPKGRRTAELFYLDELSCSEIAGTLSVPVGTVKRRLHDARHRMRDMLLGHVAEPVPDEPSVPMPPSAPGMERRDPWSQDFQNK